MPIRLTPDAFRNTKLGKSPENQKIVAAALAGKTVDSSVKAQSLAGLEHSLSQHVQVQALEQGEADKPKRKSRVRILIEIIRFGRKEFDEDNLIAGAKPLRDSIARSLGVDDADKRLCWRVLQVVTHGSTGTLVRIERLK